MCWYITKLPQVEEQQLRQVIKNEGAVTKCDSHYMLLWPKECLRTI